MIPIRLILDGIDHNQANMLEEIRDDLKEVKHKANFGGEWDKFKENVGFKLGFGPFKVDVIKILKDLFER